MRPPSPGVAALAATRLADLATPPGALGRLGDLGVWLAACQGEVPPRELTRVRLVIFAGDHGVADHGVSAYPAAITAAMVRTFVAGRAGVNALAAAHGVAVRVLDLGVDDDLADVPDDVRRFKVRRTSGAIHLEDALTAAQTRAALEAGAAVAREEIAAGAQLLLSGDMGIGNTTPAAALVARASTRPPSGTSRRLSTRPCAVPAPAWTTLSRPSPRSAARTSPPARATSSRRRVEAHPRSSTG